MEEKDRMIRKQTIKLKERTLLKRPGNNLYAAKIPQIALQIKKAFAMATICSTVMRL